MHNRILRPDQKLFQRIVFFQVSVTYMLPEQGNMLKIKDLEIRFCAKHHKSIIINNLDNEGDLLICNYYNRKETHRTPVLSNIFRIDKVNFKQSVKDLHLLDKYPRFPLFLFRKICIFRTVLMTEGNNLFRAS